MGKTGFEKCNEIYDKFLKNKIGQKIRVEELRKIISMGIGSSKATVYSYTEQMIYFGFLKIVGIGLFEILKKEYTK